MGTEACATTNFFISAIICICIRLCISICFAIIDCIAFIASILTGFFFEFCGLEFLFKMTPPGVPTTGCLFLKKTPNGVFFKTPNGDRHPGVLCCKQKKLMKATSSSPGDDEKVSLWHVLRHTQRKTGCTDKTLREMKQSLEPLLKVSCRSSSPEKKSDNLLLHNADAVLLQLHGCVGCEHFVFLPSDARMRCPECGHPRFNAQRKPNEVCNN